MGKSRGWWGMVAHVASRLGNRLHVSGRLCRSKLRVRSRLLGSRILGVRGRVLGLRAPTMPSVWRHHYLLRAPLLFLPLLPCMPALPPASSPRRLHHHGTTVVWVGWLPHPLALGPWW